MLEREMTWQEGISESSLWKFNVKAGHPIVGDLGEGWGKSPRKLTTASLQQWKQRGGAGLKAISETGP